MLSSAWPLIPAWRLFLCRSPAALVLAAALLISCCVRQLHAQAGAPDPTFPILQRSAQQIAVQPDGKILLSFTVYGAPYTTRLNADGSPDSAFSSSDEAGAPNATNITFSSGNTYLLSSAGGFVITNNILRRYQTDSGQLDATFAAATVPGQYIAGYYNYASGQTLVWGDALYRRGTDGTLDPGFQIPQFSSGARIDGASVTSSGSIYVWGNFTTLNGATCNGIARLNADGTPASQFLSALDPSTEVALVVQESTGSLLLGLYMPGGDFTLLRMNPDGSLDPTFQSPVINVPFFLTSTNGAGLMETTDQKIIFWGNVNEIDQVAIPGYVELDQDGTLDPTFLANAQTNGIIENIFLQPDGKLLLAGKLNRSDLAYTVPLVRLNADGSVDPAFDLVPENPVKFSTYLPSRIVIIGNPPVDDSSLLGQYIMGPIAIQPDGKILANITYDSPPPDYYDGGGVVVIIGQPPPTPPTLFLRYNGDGPYPPHTPIPLVVTSVSPQLTHLAWKSVADETGYQVERQESGIWVVKATLGPTVLFYDDTTADGVTNFSYRVEAINTNGLSVPTPATAASPPGTFFTPFTLTVTPISPTQVSLAWSAVPNPTWEYDIYRETGTATLSQLSPPQTPTTQIATVDANTLTYVDPTASPLQTYTYAVVARNVAGQSDSSVQTITMPDNQPPVTPANFLATPVNPRAIQLVWTTAPGATGYTIERSTNGIDGWQQLATLGAGATGYLDNVTLVPNQTYYYRITAVDLVGSSAASTVVSAVSHDSAWSPPGTLDPTFNPTVAITGLSGLKVAPSGIVYYATYSSSNLPGVLHQVSPTGMPGPSFTPYSSGSIEDFLPLPGGDVLVAAYGSASSSGTTVYQVLYVTSAGAVTSTVNFSSYVPKLLPLHSGKFLATGLFSSVNGIPSNGIARLNSDGTLDTTFNMTGSALPYVFIRAVEQSDSKLVINLDGATLIRLMPDGTPDSTFATAGKVVLSGSNNPIPGELSISATQLSQAVQADDSILLGGTFTTVDDGSGPVASSELARLTPDGKVDPAFNVGAGFPPVVNGSNGPGSTYSINQSVSGITIDSAGRILVQGNLVLYNTIPCNTVVRLLPNGELDPSFLLPNESYAQDFLDFCLNSDGQTYYLGDPLHRYLYEGVTNSTLSFGQWQARYNLTGSGSSMVHNDNVPILLKYLYDISPSSTMSSNDCAAMPQPGMTTTNGSSCLPLSYRQNPSLTGVTVNVQTSTDLVSWQTVNPPDYLQQTGTDPITNDPIMTIGVQAAPTGHQYIRLQVVAP